VRAHLRSAACAGRVDGGVVRGRRGSRVAAVGAAACAVALAIGFIPDVARERLAARGLAFDAATFVAQARRGDLATVRLFLRAGMDPDALDGDGRTALMEAARLGNLPLMETLVEAGAEPDFRGKYLLVDPLGGPVARPAGTPLDLATDAGALDAVRFLLRERAHERGRAGAEALLAAAGQGRLDLVDALLDAGVPPGGDPDGPRSPVGAAMRAGHLDVARRLVAAGARLDGPLATAEADALAAAVVTGDAARVLLLLAAGAAPTGRDPAGRPLAVAAALRDAPDVVAALARAGAPLDVDTGAAAALLSAHAGGRRAGLAALVEAAHATSAATGPVWATLDRAVAAPDVELVVLLRELGLSADDVADLGLLDAARAGDAARARAALAAGADPDVEDWDGRPAVALALDGRHADAVRALVQAGARRMAVPLDAVSDLVQAMHGPAPVVRRAAARTDPDAADPGTTPLMLAAWRGDLDLVRTLLARGADPRLRDRRGAAAADLARARRAREHAIGRKLTCTEVARALDGAGGGAVVAAKP
jgi:ankyrin repeat protein